MNILILDLLICSFISFAQITDSYKMYTMDKNGKITFQRKPLHIDVEYMNKDFGDRLKKQLDDYLETKHGKEADTTKFTKINKDGDLTRIIKASPSTHDNRIILDVDNLNEKDMEYYTYEPKPEDKNNVKSDEIVTDIKHLNPKQINALNQYLKNQKSLRKYNEIIAEFRSKHHSAGKKNKKNKYKDGKYKNGPIKRFRVVHNRKGKHNKMPVNWDNIIDKSVLSCEQNDDRPECHERAKIEFDSFSGEHKRHQEDDDSVYEYTDDDELFYLQGPRKVKKKDSEKDKRRRLSHFMPKRYHWDPEDIHHLGYFWFNGPRGQYPYPQRVE